MPLSPPRCSSHRHPLPCRACDQVTTGPEREVQASAAIARLCADPTLAPHHRRVLEAVRAMLTPYAPAPYCAPSALDELDAELATRRAQRTAYVETVPDAQRDTHYIEWIDRRIVALNEAIEQAAKLNANAGTNADAGAAEHPLDAPSSRRR